MDPELLTLLQPMMAASAELDPPAIGDIATRRERIAPLLQLLADLRGPVPGVEVARHTLLTADGAQLDMSWYFSSESPGSAVLYLHGGGMIHGLAETGAGYDAIVRSYVAASGVPMLLVDYRV